MVTKYHILDDTFDECDWSITKDLDMRPVSLRECEVLLTGFSTVIDENFIKRCSNLRTIVTPTTAVDHVDVDINVISLIPDKIKDIRASSEFALLLILSLLRRCKTKKREENIGEDLYGKAVGILGGGRIGSNLVNYVLAMGAVPMVYDIIQDRSRFSKIDVLSNSDIVVLAVSSIEENRNSMSCNEFNIMKNGSYFVNIARDFLVNEEDLKILWERGKFQGVATDVVSSNSCLYKCEGNFIITPHLAGHTVQSKFKACNFVLKELVKHENSRDMH